MLYDIVFESIGLLLGIFVGAFSYKRLNPFYRLLYIQLLFWLFFYVLSYIVTNYQSSHGLKENNQWVFNLQILVETIFLLLAAGRFFNKQFAKNVLKVIIALYVCLYVIIVISGSFFEFCVVAYNVESIVVIVTYSIIVFTCFYDTFMIEIRHAEIWASIGLILYFGCNLPYFSLFNYLNNHYPDMSESLHRHITDVFSNIRYILLAVGFLLVNRSHSLETPSI